MKTLLERGNTRLAPLDTVEPDAKMRPGGTCASIQRLKDNCSVENQRVNGWLDDDISFLYSRPKVESLLSQCRKEARKEALLEAAAWFANREFVEGYGHKTITAYADDELRRMADNEVVQDGNEIT